MPELAPSSQWVMTVPVGQLVDHGEHFGVLVQSHNIYLDRDKFRGDLWRSRPPSHKLEMIREKHDRAKRALNRMVALFEMDPALGANELLIKEYEDSLLDIINFAVFAIREVREGQRG